MPEFAENYLLSESQLSEMMTKLSDVYDDQHSDILWKRLLPEWGLAVFMQKFGMTRKETSAEMRATSQKDSQRFSESDDDY